MGQKSTNKYSMHVKVDHFSLTTRLNYPTSYLTMETTNMQMDTEKSNSWLYYKLGIHTLALVLQSGITITTPDPKVDAKLQVTSGIHHGGTIKVIVVRLPSNKIKPRHI